jgi:hypothetical protein
MRYIFTFLLTISLGFLVGYQTQKPNITTENTQQIVVKQVSPDMPENLAFQALEDDENKLMRINSVSEEVAQANHTIPLGYGMYADFSRKIAVDLIWPEKDEDVDYLFLGVGSTENSVKTRPWGDIYAGYVTDKTNITIALPEEWSTDEDVMSRILYVRLWQKIGSRWEKEDFAFLVSEFAEHLCEDTVEPICGYIEGECEDDYCLPGYERTFVNECSMERAGATKKYWGMCGNQGGTCDDNYEPVCGMRYPTECEAYILESNEDGFETDPKCQAIYETYTNTCEMRNAGADMMYWGACNEETSINIKNEYLCENAASLGISSYLPNQIGDGGEIMECEDGYTRIKEPSYIADGGDILLDEYYNIVTRCGAYLPEGQSDPAICSQINCWSTGEYLCEEDDSSQIQCPAVYNPVCAEKNGEKRTYSNSCVARSKNATPLYEGECSETEGEETEMPNNCSIWYDGCNTCTLLENGEMVCTEMACQETAEEECLKYTQESENKIPLQCSIWNDGCNVCEVIDGDIVSCGNNTCESTRTPTCIEFNQEYDDDIVCENVNETVCGEKRGRLKDYKNACELYKDEANMFAYNECDNTYRARLFEVTDGENIFVMKIDEPERIIDARNILAGYEEEKIHPTGIVSIGSSTVYDNYSWNFLVKSTNIDFIDESQIKETCDVSIQELAERIDNTGKTELPANRWCHSDLTLVREIPGTYKIR